jgi:hypothetical protein
LGDFWAWDGNVLNNKKHPKTKAPIANHFRSIFSTVEQKYRNIYTPFIPLKQGAIAS